MKSKLGKVSVFIDFTSVVNLHIQNDELSIQIYIHIRIHTA